MNWSKNSPKMTDRVLLLLLIPPSMQCPPWKLRPRIWLTIRIAPFAKRSLRLVRKWESCPATMFIIQTVSFHGCSFTIHVQFAGMRFRFLLMSLMKVMRERIGGCGAWGWDSWRLCGPSVLGTAELIPRIVTLLLTEVSLEILSYPSSEVNFMKKSCHTYFI